MARDDNAVTSTWLAAAEIEGAASVASASDGDLWPSAWADDDALYAACGDGKGFSDEPWSDIVVNRIDGTPQTGLTGVRLAAGREVSPVWTDPLKFNSKPTGMVAVDGNRDGSDELYLAVQDLGFGEEPWSFNEVPAAGIATSSDYGRTWTATGPMFTDHLMTTLMFLDFGRSNAEAVVMDGLDAPGAGEYAYAYGIDGNWRGSYSGVVDDPTDLYLARVHTSAITDRSAWEFWTGLDAGGRPVWSTDLERRLPVLTDTRRIWVGDMATSRTSTPIAQGGVLYNRALRRFVYTSWTEFTFEFYEAPAPWGPWRLFLRRDFGGYPWQGPAGPSASHGGYATTIPSKFVSEDGRDLWVQSNWFVGVAGDTGNTYHFSLRRLRLEPAVSYPPREGEAAR